MNIIPFIAEAMGTSRKIYELIDKLYDSDPENFCDQEVKKINLNKIELDKLREFLFNKENEEKEESEESEYIEKIFESGVIVGGSEKWQNGMKKYLPNFSFIKSEQLNFDINILKDKKTYINIKKMSHGMYYKVVSANRNIAFISNNVKLALKKILELSKNEIN